MFHDQFQLSLFPGTQALKWVGFQPRSGQCLVLKIGLGRVVMPALVVVHFQINSIATNTIYVLKACYKFKAIITPQAW